MASDGPSSNELPPYDIAYFFHGVSDYNAGLGLRCYGKQFFIIVSEANLVDGSQIKREYQRLYDRLNNLTPPGGDDVVNPDEEGSDAMEYLCFWIAQKCNHRMHALRATCPPLMYTLQDWFGVEKIVLKMAMTNGDSIEINTSLDLSRADCLTPRMKLPSSLTGKIATFDPTTILLPTDFEFGSARPGKVSFKSDTYFFKPANHSTSASQEINTLLRIQEHNLTQVVHAPNLHGVVLCAEDSSMIHGYLLDYIEHRSILLFIDVQKEPPSVRSEWIRQISEMIGALHDAGIIWGDAKPDNILVDTNNNLRIIDFEGGFTSGWVDEADEGTIEGDNKALSRIIDFLNTGEYPD